MGLEKALEKSNRKETEYREEYNRSAADFDEYRKHAELVGTGRWQAELVKLRRLIEFEQWYRERLREDFGTGTDTPN